MKMTQGLLWAGALVLASGAGAAAQGTPPPARGFVGVGVGGQLAARTVPESGTFTLYDEPGSFTGTRPIDKGAFVDIGGGVRVVGKLSVGVAYTRLVGSADVPFTVVAPHPLFFNQPRTATLTVTGLGHTESAVHLQGIYQVFATGRYAASVFLGPSIVHVSQDAVPAITVTETGAPYTAVTLTATFASASKTAVGGHIGADFTYRVARGVGVGAFVRYTGATVRLPGPDGATQSVRAGGPQVGVGLRYSF
jgi:hypothetical protein